MIVCIQAIIICIITRLYKCIVINKTNIKLIMGLNMVKHFKQITISNMQICLLNDIGAQGVDRSKSHVLINKLLFITHDNTFKKSAKLL